MADKKFVQIGYYDESEEFQRGKLQAEDVEATNGKTAEDHITDTTIHLTADQRQKIEGAIQSTERGAVNGVASLDASGKVPASQLDLSKYTTQNNVADYSAMLALSTTDAPVNSYVFVSDASDDETVDEGWAIYRRVAGNGNAADWHKVAEGESLDVSFSTDELESDIEEAKEEAFKLDAAYCTDEQDMKSKNLRPGALILMAVE